MVQKSRYTLPREIEIARIAPSLDDSEGERIELRHDGVACVAAMVTRRSAAPHTGRGATLEAALDELAKALPAAAQRTSRAGSTIAVSKLRRLQAIVEEQGGRLSLQRSASLLGPWKAEAFFAASPGPERAFADTVCNALSALIDGLGPA